MCKANPNRFKPTHFSRAWVQSKWGQPCGSFMAKKDNSKIEIIFNRREMIHLNILSIYWEILARIQKLTRHMQVLVNYKRKWCSFKYSVQLLAVWVVYSTAPVNNRHDEEFQPEGYCAALRRHPRDFWRWELHERKTLESNDVDQNFRRDEKDSTSDAFLAVQKSDGARPPL